MWCPSVQQPQFVQWKEVGGHCWISGSGVWVQGAGWGPTEGHPRGEMWVSRGGRPTRPKEQPGLGSRGRGSVACLGAEVPATCAEQGPVEGKREGQWGRLDYACCSGG